MLLWLVLGFYQNWPAPNTRPWPLGGHIILWILLALLGWKTFGPAIHG